MTASARQRAQELPCIWVLAGVLSYRLCDRNYQCEGCELHHALRGKDRYRREADSRLGPGTGPGPEGATPETALEERVGSCLSSLVAGCKLHLDRFYTRAHFWLHPHHGDRVALGLDDHILRLLRPIDEIVAPRAGLRIRRGEPCGWIARRKMALPLETPISGEVEAVNEMYLEAVRTTTTSRDADPWLLRLLPGEPLGAVDGLCRGEGALSLYLRNIQLVKQYLREALSSGPVPGLGLTLPDGGVRELDLEAILGPEGFERLVHDTLHLEV
ncbi:MAG: hypothetical protein HY704_02130 [Gemmatimonadetes bacterium]|nr:hypothetical protein [Gemmatimonadota bacterium]